MNFWQQAPYVRLLIPFLAGSIAAIYIPYPDSYTLPAIIALISCTLLSLILKLRFSYKYYWIFGITLNSIVFLSAYQLTIFNTDSFSPKHYTRYSHSAQYASVQLTEPYQEKEKSLKVTVQINAVKQNNTWYETMGKAMLYIKKDNRSLKLNYGDVIIIKARFNDILPPQNPGQFDYKHFLEYHNIYRQAYINNESWLHTGQNKGNTLIRYTTGLRDSLLSVMRSYNIKGEEYAVGSALLLGFEDKLDADIISAYSSTGALHVLSVSGLHVAIVYLIFNGLLFFMDKFKYGNVLKATILILLLWAYAALTGLSPSVLRAATMFSFIIAARAYNRYINIYNMLAASAFILLLYNPYLIMEVGFQLSYLAVIGIIYIQPKIYAWFEVNNWLIDQIWAITTVSIAAQIATFPLSLLYFHQFPNYFLLSNLIVIPISTLVVYIGVALFVFAKISVVATGLAAAFHWCVWLLNWSVKYIETWPYSLLQGMSISIFETWVMYAAICLLLYYFAKQKFRYILITLAMGIAILCSQIVEQQQQYKQKKFIVYNIPNTSALDFIHSQSTTLLTDTAFAHNDDQLLFYIKHNWWDIGIRNTTIVSNNIKAENLIITNNHIQFFDKRIAIINSEQIKKGNTDINHIPSLTVDYLILSQSPDIHIRQLTQRYHFNTLIFDSSNSLRLLKRWKKECTKLNISYHSVSDAGAFVVDL